MYNLTFRLLEDEERELEAEPFSSQEAFLEGCMELVDVFCRLYDQLTRDDSLPYSFREEELTENNIERVLYGSSHSVEVVPFAARALSWWQRSLALSGEHIAFCEVARRLKLNDFEQFLVLIALAPEINRKYEKLFQYFQNDRKNTHPTLGFTVDIYRHCRELSDEEVYRCVDRYTPLNAMLLLPWKQENAPLLTRPLGLWKTAVEYLMGVDNEPDVLAVFCRRLKPQGKELLHHAEEAEKCRQFLLHDTGKCRLLYLYGEKGSGKRFLLTTLDTGENGLYLVDTGYLRQKGEKESEQLFAMIAGYCGLRGLVPLLQIYGTEGRDLCTERTLCYLGRWFGTLCISAETEPWQELAGDFDFLAVELTEPDSNMQKSLWEYQISEKNLSVLQGREDELVNSYRLNPGQIVSLSELLEQRLEKTAGTNKKKKTADDEALWQACRETIREFVAVDAAGRLKNAAKEMKSGFSREDLVLPPEQTAVFDFVVEVIRHQYQVQETLGFRAKLPYGRGISVLLYGPPGTGKTMTAQVLAAEVGLTLFRVDASKIMDKYIGETEKKLGTLFDVAEKTNAILFFDEADALFSARTQVDSSNDKYSNAETSYLLQRMESYHGLTVLATNHSNYFDEAFRRRITYSINIPMPDEKTRLRIWEGIFPKQVMVDSSVNFAELAEKFTFSGSSIKYVALEAVYAAAIAGTAVTRQCIRTGLMLEYAKNGRMLGMSEYPAASLLDVERDDE